jgi:hypothetical protein
MMLRHADRHPMAWIDERRGRSGTRYKLAFRGTQFRRLSIMVPFTPMPGAPLYWKVLWDAAGRRSGALSAGPKPRSKAILAAFDDLGLKGQMQQFMRGRHVRMVEIADAQD